MTHSLDRLQAGMPIVFGGNRVVHVPEHLAAAFQPGDRLVVVQETGDLLHVPAAEWTLAQAAVTAASEAFLQLARIPDEAITRFFLDFAARLEDDTAWQQIEAANAADVAAARERGRSTTRLAISPKMRADMIAGLRGWAAAPAGRGSVVERLEHQGWSVELVSAGLGVVGFVFEGRPNVFADACGVVRGGNTVVFRIGSDALGTARAMMAQALRPALASAGLPAGSVVLLESPARASGWALFSDGRLALAVARGSGPAVAQLGAVARQAGIAVSLHGTGGAWLVATRHADPFALEQAVLHSLDRKVCNTANVILVEEAAAADLVPRVLEGLVQAGQRRGHGERLHVLAGSERWVPADWFGREVVVRRASGDRTEPAADVIPEERLAEEWEWEETPEVSLGVVPSLEAAIRLCNRWSPRFVASLVSRDRAEQAAFWDGVDAPFVGNGFTRWVDGQYALNRPELGLSNWQSGRLFGRGGILSGDVVRTLRTRMHQDDPSLHR